MKKDGAVMAYSKAQMEANHRYRAKAYEVIQVTVKKGIRDRYKAQAAAHGLSLNAYIISLLDKDAGVQPELLADAVEEKEN